MRLSLTSSAIRSIMRVLFTWYGISRTMIDARELRLSVSIDASARIVNDAAAGQVGLCESPAVPEQLSAGRKIGARDDVENLLVRDARGS